MKELVFATNNRNKLKEADQILRDRVVVLNLDDIGCREEIEENETTIEGNALLKARYVSRNYDMDAFADDTGLEVYALNMEPGVFSARYAGEPSNAESNIRLLLSQMQGKSKRNARFRTVIALMLDGKEHLFEGIIEGQITEEVKGNSGFGYDPVFIPNGSDKTFAELSAPEKNAISHRGIALRKMAEFLESKKLL